MTYTAVQTLNRRALTFDGRLRWLVHLEHQQPQLGHTLRDTREWVVTPHIGRDNRGEPIFVGPTLRSSTGSLSAAHRIAHRAAAETYGGVL